MDVGVDLVGAERQWTIQTDAVGLMTGAMIEPRVWAVGRNLVRMTDLDALVVLQVTTSVRGSLVSATEQLLAVLPDPPITTVTMFTDGSTVVEHVDGMKRRGFRRALSP